MEELHQLRPEQPVAAEPAGHAGLRVDCQPAQAVAGFAHHGLAVARPPASRYKLLKLDDSIRQERRSYEPGVEERLV